MRPAGRPRQRLTSSRTPCMPWCANGTWPGSMKFSMSMSNEYGSSRTRHEVALSRRGYTVSGRSAAVVAAAGSGTKPHTMSPVTWTASAEAAVAFGMAAWGSSWGSFVHDPPSSNCHPWYGHSRQPVVSSTRPSESGARRCGQASARTDHAAPSAFHATYRSPPTVTAVGLAVPAPRAETMGIQCPAAASSATARRRRRRCGGAVSGGAGAKAAQPAAAMSQAVRMAAWTVGGEERRWRAQGLQSARSSRPNHSFRERIRARSAVGVRVVTWRER